jgi:hypothetical protein
MSTTRAPTRLSRGSGGCLLHANAHPHALSSKEALTGRKEDFSAVIRRPGQQTEND